jgi:small nuclear ribonucleoprotein (snRNP)-like protein
MRRRFRSLCRDSVVVYLKSGRVIGGVLVAAHGDSVELTAAFEVGLDGDDNARKTPIEGRPLIPMENVDYVQVVPSGALS